MRKRKREREGGGRREGGGGRRVQNDTKEIREIKSKEWNREIKDN